MRLRNFLIAVAVLAIAVPAGALAAPPENTGRPAESGFKVTGGGQIIANPQGGGAGDTVGFNAQEMVGDDPASPDTDDAARGQFQYVPRGESSGTQQEATEKFHGVVTCLISGQEAVDNERNEGDGNYEEELVRGTARFGGYIRGTENDEDGPTYFTVDVEDNGQPNDEDDDLILVRITNQPCADNPEDEEEDDPEDLLRLGRGNVKIHNNPDGEAGPAARAAFAAYAVKAVL